MLKNRTFVKKTRKGGVVKVVQEHYLRDDVWCGVIGCPSCQSSDAILQPNCINVQSNLCSNSHFIIPDTNVVCKQVSCYSVTNPILKLTCYTKGILNYNIIKYNFLVSVM